MLTAFSEKRGSSGALTDSSKVLPSLDVWSMHRRLAEFNKTRLLPQTPLLDWMSKIDEQVEILKLEEMLLKWEIRQIKVLSNQAPQEPKAFMEWFEDLKEEGPGQNHSLFPWLAKKANKHQMRWFIKQEIVGEVGFDDLTALTQVKLPTQAKLEVARNYWDEMGKGREAGMHGPMLTEVARELEIDELSQSETVEESLALGNILLGFAVNRRYAYHSIGALGAVELTAPGRAQLVCEGLKRLGISSAGFRYYLLHSSIDVKHSEDWNREVIFPIVRENPALCAPIAEGALVRLNAGARCFGRYHKELCVPN